MTDEEKARELSLYKSGDIDILRYDTALAMAEWKDEQFEDEKKDLLGLVNMLSVDEKNQTIIEDLKALLQ